MTPILRLVFVLIFVTATLPGGSIGINFGSGRADASLSTTDSAGVIPQTNWNNVPGNAGSRASLLDGSGTSRPTGVTWSMDEQWSLGGTPADANGTLMNGWVSANNNGSADSIEIRDIPYARYDLYLYLNHDRGSEDVLISETGGAFADFLAHENDTAINAPVTFVRQLESAAANPSASGNYVRFEDLGAATLNLRLTPDGRAGSADRGAITAIQIVETTVVAGLPAVDTLTASGVAPDRATLNGEVLDNGEGAAPAAVTFFWGESDGGSDPARWSGSLAGGTRTSPGAVSATLDSLQPGTTYFYRVRVDNAVGEGWAPESATFQTPPAPPVVLNAPVSDVFATSATLAAEVAASGGERPRVVVYYGASDGGTVPGDWDEALDLGEQSGLASGTVVNLSPGTDYFFRASASNDGGTSWAASSATFRTSLLALPAVRLVPASAVNGTFATLGGEVTESGGDPPSLNLFFGTTDGGQSPAGWDFSSPIGTHTGAFARLVSNLAPTTTYFFNVRASNAAGEGWGGPSFSFTTPEFVVPSVVINEIHYDEDDKTERAEFVELHNPSDSAIDLSGYAFTSGIDYVFPGGTTLAAGGYLVVAEDPATAISKFAVSDPLGPFAKGTRLRNSGETLTLSNPGGVVVDEVSYSLGFPWPTVGDERGEDPASPSIELVNPLLDNDLAGSWRASGFPAARSTGGENDDPVTLVAGGAAGWSYRAGLSYPASDVTGREWWDPSYQESDDGQWREGTLPIGFGDNDDATVLPDMVGNYISVFVRQEFTLAPGEVPTAVTLRCYHDDGAVAYLNGIEVARFSVDPGAVPFPVPDRFANNHEAAWSEITLTGVAAYLTEGVNVLALQGINANLGSSDFSLDAELVTVPGGAGETFRPTPGAPNASFALEVPPQIRQVAHEPLEPVSGQAVTITAKVTDPEGVASVSLQYQLVEPGDYFCRYLKFNTNGTPNPDPRYEDPAEWTSLTMFDDGRNGDALAHDDIFTVVLPAGLQVNRRLIRYRLTATDTREVPVTVPYPDDPQPNFAYFVYDGTPDWSGSIRPGDPAVTYPGSLMSSIPTYFLLTTSQWTNDSQFGGYSGSEYLWPGSLVYDGKVYDHIQYRPRGGVHRFQYGKNFWKFDFKRGHRFQARDRYGKKYETDWDKLNFSSIVQQVNFGHRGEQGLFEGTGFKLFQLAGVEACHTHYTQFYVVDDSNATGTNQYHSDYHGLYLAIEQMDGQFLDEHGLPDGNLYKIEGHRGESNNQGPYQVGNGSDVASFISAYRSGNPSADWWRENLDLDKYFSYRTIVEGIHHYDIAYGKNYFYYHNPVSEKFEVHPWDLDLTWANNMYGNGNHDFKTKVAQNPAFNMAYQNRVRELMDLLYNNDEGNRVVDEMVKDVWNPDGPSLVGADRRLWDNHPRITAPDRYYDISRTRDFDGMIELVKNYLTSRGNWMTSNLLTSEAALPATPVISRVGGSLTFASSAYDSPVGAGFDGMEWRLSEISHPEVPGYDPAEPYRYEIEDPFESGELTPFAEQYAFPLVAARPGRTYRARVRHRDADGRWSHWSDPVEFAAATPDVTPYQNALVISEIMFNPPAPSGGERLVSLENDDFEFLEIRNVSGQPVDLTGVRFTKGVDFDFADGTVLAPGAYLLLVKNVAAFEARYGTGLPVAGSYGGDNLSNGGEQLKLSLGAGTAILDFVYGDGAPWPGGTDGNGQSLTLVAPKSRPDHALPESWRASAVLLGSPGGEDGETYQSWALANQVTGLPEDDGDGDGISHLMEFALGGDPGRADTAILPVVRSAGGIPTLEYLRSTAAVGLTFEVEFSTDLENWSSDLSVNSSSTILPDGLTAEVWQFQSVVPSSRPVFARLRVGLQ